jgi:hypothetical protein
VLFVWGVSCRNEGDEEKMSGRVSHFGESGSHRHLWEGSQVFRDSEKKVMPSCCCELQNQSDYRLLVFRFGPRPFGSVPMASRNHGTE